MQGTGVVAEPRSTDAERWSLAQVAWLLMWLLTLAPFARRGEVLRSAWAPTAVPCFVKRFTSTEEDPQSRMAAHLSQ